MTHVDRLHAVLDEAEREGSVLELDQIAWVLARLQRAAAYDKTLCVLNRPKLASHVEDIERQLEQESPPTAWERIEGDPIERPMSDPSRSKPRTLLSLSGWRDREDRVGQVVTLIFRMVM